jgi:DNA-binding transcriptional LysR family regulator
MDRLASMSVLMTAVEAGSLSAAARHLRMPLATVSRKVSDLEAHLKARLLNRSSRQLTLTDAGRSYVEACKRILEAVSEAERAASGEYGAPRGDLIITAPIVFGRLHVLPVVLTFLRAFPEIDIRLVLTDHVVNMIDEPIDLAVRIGALPDSSLLASRVGSIRHVVCGSPSYFAERGTPKRPDQLGSHDVVTSEGMTAADAWRFKIGKVDESVAVHSRLVVNTAEAAIDAAISGLGVTRVLSYQIADAVRAGRLVPVLQKFEPEPLPLNLVYRGGRVPLKLRGFLDYAAPRLRARLTSSPV